MLYAACGLVGLNIAGCGYIWVTPIELRPDDAGVEADTGVPIDAGPDPVCGDDLCEPGAGENPCTCPDDCGETTAPDALSTNGSDTVTAGTPYTLTLRTCRPATSWTINWGDGSIDNLPGTASEASHTYTRAGFTYNILASVVSEGSTVLQNELLVTNNTGDDVAWFNPDGSHQMSTGPTPGLAYPTGLAIGPDGNLYVGSFDTHNVQRYNIETGEFIDEFVARSAGGLEGTQNLTFGPDGNLYVASFRTRSIKRFDGSTGAFIDDFVAFAAGTLRQPAGLIFGPDGNLYVTSYASNLVLRYNGSTGAFIDEFADALGGVNAPVGLVFGPDGHLYVANDDGHTVTRYDGRTGAPMGHFVGPEGGILNAIGLAFGPDGNLYVTSWRTNEVRRFDGTTGALLDVFASTALNDPAELLFVPQQRVRVVP